MKLSAALFVLLFFSLFQLSAQTTISDDVSFENAAPESHALYTTNGDVFIGRALFIRNDTVGFQIRQLTDTTRFLFSDIRFLGTRTEAFQNSNNSWSAEAANTAGRKSKANELPMPLNQLLYSGTAIPYESKGTYRNTMVLVNQVDYQIGKHLVIGGGAFIPLALMAKVKGQISISEMLHIGLAVHQYAILFDNLSITHPYAIVTVGQAEQFLNFTTGYWVERYTNFSPSTEVYPMVTLGGSFAFAKGWRFYAEAAAVFQTFDNLVLPTFNFSNHRRKGMFEIGLLAVPDSQVPLIPLLSYHRIF